jgi:hypothetical protein
MLKGRKLIVVTKHQKEKVIQPLFAKAFNMLVVASSQIDTDTFGTFSGEIERTDEPLVAAKNKCLAAAKIFPNHLLLASEGSFFPHPALPFAAVNQECLLLFDPTNNFEVSITEYFTETNYAQKTITNEQDLLAFAKSTGFPQHALILKNGHKKFTRVLKGIQDLNTLKSAYQRLVQTNKTIVAQTDMRACFNPTRMQNIAKAAEKLIVKLNSVCEVCHTPGFGITRNQYGLPCMVCNNPTSGLLAHVYTCSACGFTKTVMYPNNITHQNPMYCDFCNP